MRTELLLVHVLRLACGPNGPLGDILPQITSELSDLGLLEHVKDLAIVPSSTFNKTFSDVFGHHMVPRFWDIAHDSRVSCYLNDFVELQQLGRGGYGHVVLCKNKLDGRQYAVKKICLKEKSLRDRILRHGWKKVLLTTMVMQAGDLELPQAPVSASRMEVHHISMSMKMNFHQNTCIFKWNTVQAKFLKREQLEQDIDASEAIGVSIDGTGQVGTYFYTAPEIEQGWPKIDEKADMYSLGVVFFELWHPFQTGMERHKVLSDLKQKGELPSAWVAEFPEQASLLMRLMSPSPSDRPSANEVLEHAVPPRMEHVVLNNFLRTIHTSEGTTVYNKIVNSLFDADMLAMKDRACSGGRSKLDGDDTSSATLICVNTRN